MPQFYSYQNKMKEDLSEVLEDELIYNNLSLNIKSRVYKVLNSNNYDEFKELDKHKEFSNINIIVSCIINFPSNSLTKMSDFWIKMKDIFFVEKIYFYKNFYKNLLKLQLNCLTFELKC